MTLHGDSTCFWPFFYVAGGKWALFILKTCGRHAESLDRRLKGAGMIICVMTKREPTASPQQDLHWLSKTLRAHWSLSLAQVRCQAQALAVFCGVLRCFLLGYFVVVWLGPSSCYTLSPADHALNTLLARIAATTSVLRTCTTAVIEMVKKRSVSEPGCSSWRDAIQIRWATSHRQGYYQCAG